MTNLVVFQSDAVFNSANKNWCYDGRPVRSHCDRIRNDTRRRMSRRIYCFYSELITPSRLETAQRQMIVLHFARRGFDPMRRNRTPVLNNVSCETIFFFFFQYGKIKTIIRICHIRGQFVGRKPRRSFFF